MCPNVEIEPGLLTISGENFALRSANIDKGGRLDIKAQNFWDKTKSSVYFDVWVFYAHAPSNHTSSINASYKKHKMEKKRAYERRIIYILNIDHGTFSPLAFCTRAEDGVQQPVLSLYRKLASIMATKYSQYTFYQMQDLLFPYWLSSNVFVLVWLPVHACMSSMMYGAEI